MSPPERKSRRPGKPAAPSESTGSGYCESSACRVHKRASETAVAVWLDFAMAPWFGSCTGCGREQGTEPELAGCTGRGTWMCTQCLTEMVRAHVIAELGRCAS